MTSSLATILYNTKVTYFVQLLLNHFKYRHLFEETIIIVYNRYDCSNIIPNIYALTICIDDS